MVQLRGRLFDHTNGQGLAGVAVSNGEHIVRTDEDGQYCLDAEPDKHPFVWFTQPDGYRAAGDFYARVPAEGGQLDFALLPAPQRNQERFRLAQITDTHVVEEEGQLSTGPVLAAALAQLVAEAAPDLLVVSGDLTNRGTPGELGHFKAAIQSIDVPVFPFFGGHDGNEERFAGPPGQTFTRNYEQALGPCYYSFDWGGRHFVLYANEEYFWEPADQERKKAWLWRDLALQPPGRDIVVVVHIPPTDDFLDELRAHGVSTLLHGHWHSSKSFVRDGLQVAATPPLCFGGIDTTARGYRLLDFAPAAKTALALQALGRAPLLPKTPEQITAGQRRWTLEWTREVGPGHRAAPLLWDGGLALSRGDEGGATSAALLNLDPHSGQVLWEVGTEATVKNSPVAVEDGGLAAVSVTGRLHLVDGRTGALRWQADLPDFPQRWVYSAPVAADGVVYVGAKKGYGAYRQTDGALLWYSELETSDNWSCYASPQISGGLLLMLVPRRGLLALDRASGRIVWEQALQVEYQYGAPVLAGDWLISGGDKEQLAALQAASGEIVWQQPVLPGAYASGLAADGARIYAVGPTGQVSCHDLADGTALWRFQSGSDLLDMTPYQRGIASLLAAPVVDEAVVWVGANDGQLYALDKETGACLGQADCGEPLAAAPVVRDDWLYVRTWGGRLLAYRRAE